MDISDELVKYFPDLVFKATNTLLIRQTGRIFSVL